VQSKEQKHNSRILERKKEDENPKHQRKKKSNIQRQEMKPTKGEAQASGNTFKKRLKRRVTSSSHIPGQNKVAISKMRHLGRKLAINELR